LKRTDNLFDKISSWNKAVLKDLALGAAGVPLRPPPEGGLVRRPK
jgi:hypothetical protein